MNLKNKIMCVKDCFDKNGNFIDNYNPFYEKNERPSIYEQLYEEDGYAIHESVAEVEKLINKNKWNWKSDAVKYYYAYHNIMFGWK